MLKHPNNYACIYNYNTCMCVCVDFDGVLCYGTRAFRQTAAKTWNSLPDDVRLADKLETFISRLKTHLYRLSYC